MHKQRILSFMQSKGLRDTQSRRFVVEALEQISEPVSPYDIQAWIEKKHGTISPVTVYRITERLIQMGLVHKHPCSGKMSLCEHIGKEGTHAFLHCDSCGNSEEIHHDALSAAMNIAARSQHFTHLHSLIELTGLCQSCSTSS